MTNMNTTEKVLWAKICKRVDRFIEFSWPL